MAEPSDDTIEVTVSGEQHDLPTDFDPDGEQLMRATGHNPNFCEIYRVDEDTPFVDGEVSDGDEFALVSEYVNDG